MATEQETEECAVDCLMPGWELEAARGFHFRVPLIVLANTHAATDDAVNSFLWRCKGRAGFIHGLPPGMLVEMSLDEKTCVRRACVVSKRVVDGAGLPLEECRRIYADPTKILKLPGEVSAQFVADVCGKSVEPHDHDDDEGSELFLDRGLETPPKKR